MFQRKLRLKEAKKLSFVSQENEIFKEDEKN